MGYPTLAVSPGGYLFEAGAMPRSSRRERRRKRRPPTPPDEESGTDTVVEYETDSSDDEPPSKSQYCSCSRRARMACWDSVRDLVIASALLWWCLDSYAHKNSKWWYTPTH